MNRSIFLNWQPETFFLKKLIKNFNINFGPQHPATHGVLRLILQLNNELIEKLDIHIGYLHRGTEKLIETKNYLQNLPFFDRFDYMTMFIHEHVYCLNIETLINKLNYNSSLSFIRVLFDEISRILNHIIALACHALDVGSMTPIFWSFEEREKLLEFCEKISGARMHYALYKFNFFNYKLISNNLLIDLLIFCKNFFITLNEIHNTLTYNKIWKQRLINIGIFNFNDCINYGLTGIMSRSCGIKRDLRLSKNETYSNYYYLNFKSFIGQHGDCYDRYLIRMNELSESIFIIFQIVKKLLIKKNINYLKDQFIFNSINSNYIFMENILNHFKFWNNNIIIKKQFNFSAVESPKGELGLVIISDNSNKPWKCKLKSPGYHHLQILQKISKNYFIADLITLIGSIDIVFGEIDK